MKLRRVEWADIVAQMGKVRNANRIFVEKPEEKKSVHWARHRGEGSIKMEMKELRREVLYWIHLAQDTYQ
jgi:hypothetical protein